MRKHSKDLIYPIIILGLVFISTISCKKDKKNDTPSPTLSTTVTDYDGNVYHTITIGTQVWLVENLKVTHYRNGDTISNIIDDNAWSYPSIGAYSNYNHDSNNVNIYGRLYNWLAINDSRGIAPAGWHVPSDAEWSDLVNYLGGLYVAGGKMKESGTAHWSSPNTGATNSSGFSGLPGGSRAPNGPYGGIGENGIYWSSTDDGIGNAWYRYLSHLNEKIDKYSGGVEAGYSVRCIKD